MYEVSKGEIPHNILFRIWDTSNGYVGCLIGGESPHVGGVVLAVPRPSLTGEGCSCDCWLCPVPGHKDLEVAVHLAQRICKLTGTTVSLTAGIHIDNAKNEDLQIISDNCAAVGEEMIYLLQNFESEKKGEL